MTKHLETVEKPNSWWHPPYTKDFLNNFHLVLLLSYLCIFLLPGVTLADMGFEGGIANEQEYREVVYLSGEAVPVSGTLDISAGRGKDNVTKTSYTFKLSNPAKQVTLTRRLTVLTEQVEQGIQSIQNSSIDSYREEIRIAGDRYTLDDYQFSQSVVTDSRPAVSYFSGNWTGRKTYSINKSGGKAVVNMSGDLIGYRHAWGSTETRTMDIVVEVDRMKQGTGNAPTREIWEGSSHSETSVVMTRELSYVLNEPFQISFPGGYLITGTEESVMEYVYNLPARDSEGNLLSKRRVKGSGRDLLTKSPGQERLTVPELRDIKGHWAEPDIRLVAALGAIPGAGRYFGPKLPMKRADFAKAVTIAVEMVSDDQQGQEQRGRTPRGRQQVEADQPPLFDDVLASHPDYKYIEAAVTKGMMKGVGPRQFLPEGVLTRAQAVTMLIRALGFEGLAPNPEYATLYVDDEDIPYWARDSIYVATEIGLLTGDGQGYVLPNEVMSRAEAAALLSRFIKYLQDELKNEYRERIINFN